MKKSKTQIPWWLIVLALAIVFIVIGVTQGALADTLRKASLVCYECIGIG